MRNELRDFWYRHGVLGRLILVNVGLFAVLAVFRVFFTLGEYREAYDAILRVLSLPALPEKVIFQPWALLTYAFVHEGFWHLFFNMLFLYYFGRLIHDFLGAQRLLSLYILGSLAAGVFFILIYALFPLYEEARLQALLLGASGAVFAIIVAAATFSPNYTIILLIFPIRIKYIAIAYVFLSFVRLVGPNSGGELAHLGGALMGFIYIIQLRKGNDLGFLVSFFTRIFKKDVRRRKENRKKGSMSTQEEMDMILDKIASSGYKSLSKEEKQRLFDISKRSKEEEL